MNYTPYKKAIGEWLNDHKGITDIEDSFNIDGVDIYISKSSFSKTTATITIDEKELFFTYNGDPEKDFEMILLELTSISIVD